MDEFILDRESRSYAIDICTGVDTNTKITYPKYRLCCGPKNVHALFSSVGASVYIQFIPCWNAFNGIFLQILLDKKQKDLIKVNLSLSTEIDF